MPTLDELSFSTSTIRSSRREDASTPSKDHFNSVFNSVYHSSSSDTYLETLTTTLQSTGLSWVNLIGPREFIGEGSQFVAYSENMIRDTRDGGALVRRVAAKQSKFEWHSDRPLELSDSRIRKHLHHMYLEIMALTMPGLRDHPNIIRLFAWSMCALSYRVVPQLVMELATSNLTQIVSSKTERLSPEQRLALCMDVAHGLDAIHHCGLVHGDLKPDNVLIIQEGNQRHAKLADFGLCVFEQDVQEGVRLGGTPGWLAPEVQAGKLLDKEGLVRADTFSYGLLLWRVMLHQGKVLRTSATQSASSEALQELTVPSGNGEKIDNLLRESLPLLLASESYCRPASVVVILGDCNSWTCDYEHAANTVSFGDMKVPPGGETIDMTGSFNSQNSSNDQDPWPYPTSRMFGWEILALPVNFESGLCDRVFRDSYAVPVDVLLGLFLRMTVPWADHTPNHKVLEVLCVAALRGSLPARAMILFVHEYFQVNLTPQVDENVEKWLENAVVDGSVFAAHREQSINGRDAVNELLNDFRRRGGYHLHFDLETEDQHRIDSANKNLRATSSNTANEVKYGTIDEVCRNLNIKDSVLNHLGATAEKSTLVYLACMRGSWPLAQKLIGRNCDISAAFGPFNLDCLHWLFAIDESLQFDATSSLIEHGANINALATEVVPFPHYPFFLPSGSPLHWATILACQTTITCLLRCGADVLLRDGSDPYRFDRDIRYYHHFSGGPRCETFSIPEARPQGLSPLDYAAIQFNPFIFEALAEHNLSINVNDTDEEGHTVLHRLSSEPVYRTRLGVPYSIRPMQGSWQNRYEALEKTLLAIIALGGDLELLTKGGEISIIGRQQKQQKTQYTPLMLAVQRGQTDVVRALLNAGASVHTRNNLGQTALFFKQYDSKAYRDCVYLLCEHGADVQVRDLDGRTPVCIAATIGEIAIVDFMLSRGADIDSRQDGDDNIDASGQRVKTSDSIFTFLAKSVPEALDNQYDIDVAQLLEKHVLTCNDEAKRTRVMTVGRSTGQTLLHLFSTRGMPACVRTLLKAGVDVNTISVRTFLRTIGEDESVWDVRQETPLDGLIDFRAGRRRMMEQDAMWPIRVYEHRMKLDEEIDRALRDAGGVSFAEIDGEA